MSKFWVGVASRDHVKLAEAGGFCQLGHGKEAPVRRLSAGDGIIYYAPRTRMRPGAPVQAFVAMGRVCSGDVYRVQQNECFNPFRRDVTYFAGSDAPIDHLREQLSFTKNGVNWGLLVRRGLFEISEQDFGFIAEPMGVNTASLVGRPLLPKKSK